MLVKLLARRLSQRFLGPVSMAQLFDKPSHYLKRADNYPSELRPYIKEFFFAFRFGVAINFQNFRDCTFKVLWPKQMRPPLLIIVVVIEKEACRKLLCLFLLIDKKICDTRTLILTMSVNVRIKNSLKKLSIRLLSH